MTSNTIGFIICLISSINVYSQIKFDSDFNNLRHKDQISHLEKESFRIDRKTKEKVLSKTEIYKLNKNGKRTLYSSHGQLGRKDSILYDTNNNIKEIYLFDSNMSIKERIQPFYDSENNIKSVKYYLYDIHNEERLYNTMSFENEKRINNGMVRKYIFDSGIKNEFHFNKENLLVKRVSHGMTADYFIKVEYEYTERFESKDVQKNNKTILVKQFQNDCVLLNSLYEDIFESYKHISQRNISTIRVLDKNGGLIRLNHYKYDSKGNLKKDISKKIIDGKTTDIEKQDFIIEYTYDKLNNITGIKYLRANNRDTNFTYEYQYDTQNNWIEKINYKEEVKTNVIKRKIIYK